MLGGDECLGGPLAGGVDSCRVMAGTRVMRRGVEGKGVGEVVREVEVEVENKVVDGGVGGVDGVVSGRGRLEAICTSWSSSAGSGDVVEDAAVLASLPDCLSPLTASAVDPPSILLELVLECTNSSTSDGRAFNLGRRPSITLQCLQRLGIYSRLSTDCPGSYKRYSSIVVCSENAVHVLLVLQTLLKHNGPNAK